MKCLPFNSIKIVTKWPTGVDCLQWRLTISDCEHSFNDQPSWVIFHSCIVDLSWTNEKFPRDKLGKPLFMSFSRDGKVTYANLGEDSKPLTIENIHVDYQELLSKYF